MICQANTLPTIFATTDIPIGPIPEAAVEAFAAMLLDMVERTGEQQATGSDMEGVLLQ